MSWKIGFKRPLLWTRASHTVGPVRFIFHAMEGEKRCRWERERRRMEKNSFDQSLKPITRRKLLTRSLSFSLCVCLPLSLSLLSLHLSPLFILFHFHSFSSSFLHISVCIPFSLSLVCTSVHSLAHSHSWPDSSFFILCSQIQGMLYIHMPQYTLKSSQANKALLFWTHYDTSLHLFYRSIVV